MTRTYFRLNQGSALLEAKKPGEKDDGAGRYRIRIIAPGRGSTGMYTAPNLAESAPLFVPGTHMFFDHQTMTEDWERPERSVRDLAGVFESGAEIMPDGSLEADIKVYPSVNGIIRERWTDIGVSINGWSVEEIGPDGVVPVLAGIQSVDFVTRAGAKGAVLEVLESDGRWRVRNPSAPSNPTNTNVQEEQAVKPEDICKAVSEAVAAAMPAAIKEAAAMIAADQEKKVAEAKKDETPAVDPYEAAAKIAEAEDLPKEARARVMEAVKRGAGVDDAIEAERAYIKAIAPAPVVREDGAAKTGGDDVQVTSWAK
jgi:hypothetical protein|nr:MAG TPA: Prohead core protein protease [Caudoviricetes sp.]